MQGTSLLHTAVPQKNMENYKKAEKNKNKNIL